MIDAKLARSLVAEFAEAQKHRDVMPAARKHVVVRYAPKSLLRLAGMRLAAGDGSAWTQTAGTTASRVA